MAAIAPPSSSSSLKPSPYLTSGSTKSPHPISRFTHPFSPLPQKPTPFRHLQISSSLSPKTVATIATTSNPPDPEAPISRFAPDEPRKGADVLVEALERQGVTDVFAYPGGALMEIHQALTRSSSIRNVLPRQEQGGVFAAEGYARGSGCPGVCIATSGPGATNLVSESKKPVLYVGGGCLNSSEELRRFVELTGIPVASTLMGLGAHPCNDEDLSLQMLGMHGTVDLLLAFGVRTKGLFVFSIG